MQHPSLVVSLSSLSLFSITVNFYCFSNRIVQVNLQLSLFLQNIDIKAITRLGCQILLRNSCILLGYILHKMTSKIQISTFSIQILRLTAYISYTAFEQKDYYTYTYDTVLLFIGFGAKRGTRWSESEWVITLRLL